MGPKRSEFADELSKIHEAISEIRDQLASKETDNKLDAIWEAMKSKDDQIEKMESRIAILENTVNLLSEKCENNEQYSRRSSLRILNIPLPEQKETADDCLVKVKALITESGAEIDSNLLDRAHRIGKVIHDRNGGPRRQAMIVKFSTWRDRTCFYRSRKNLAEAKVHIDLTQTRFKLLKTCQAKVEANSKVDYVFADVNCSLCVKLANGKYEYFSNEHQLDTIINRST